MKIRNRVIGQKIKIYYQVEAKRDDDGRLKHKPFISSASETEWEEILSFYGNEIWTNSVNDFAINISEEESVIIQGCIFRADLNEVFLQTNKVLSTTEIGKLTAEAYLKSRIKEWNEQEISKDEKMMTYCKVHGLDIEDTSVEDLQAIVYPSKTAGILTQIGDFITDISISRF